MDELAAVTLGLAVGLVACRELDSCGAQHVVEIYTRWCKSGEHKAMVDVKDQYTESSGTTVLLTSMGNYDTYTAYLNKRLNGEVSPVPDLFQANIGENLLQWEDRLTHLPSGLTDSFYAELVSRASPDDEQGTLRGLPLNIHRINNIYYSPNKLAELDRELDEREPGNAFDFTNVFKQAISIQDFELACDAFKRVYNESPIVMGLRGAPHFFSSQLVHETLLPAMAGSAYYDNLWRGYQGIARRPKDNTESTLAESTLENLYEKVLSWYDNKYFNSDFRSLDWSQAETRIFNDQTPRALFFFMGDWATAELIESKHTQGYDFDTVSFATEPSVDPQRRPVFVYTTDCLALPSAAPHREEAKKLLETFARPDWQLSFSTQKGSVPAYDFIGQTGSIPTCDKDYPDSLVTGYCGAMKMKTIDEFRRAEQDKRLVVALSGYENLLPGDLNQKVVDMLEEGNSDKVMTFWYDNYPRE